MIVVAAVVIVKLVVQMHFVHEVERRKRRY